MDTDTPATKTITLAELPLTITANRVPLNIGLRVPGFDVEAFDGFLRGHVIQTGAEFVPCYYGQPWTHNPWTVPSKDDRPIPGMSPTRSCQCPVITLKPEQTLQAAARAAITAYATERDPDAITFQVEAAVAPPQNPWHKRLASP